MKLIEKLQDKDYVRPFGLMTPVERKCYENAGKENCLFYDGGGWESSGNDGGFSNMYAYAINFGYQSEPEFLDLPITHDGGFLCVYREDVVITRKNYPHPFVTINLLPGLPNFECFFYWKETSLREVNFDDVATRIDRDKQKVYARLRTT